MTSSAGLRDLEDVIQRLNGHTERLERLTQALRFTQIVSRNESAVPPDVAMRLGGADRVMDAVEMLYERVMADPSLSPYFQGLSEVELAYLMQQQAKMFLALFGVGDYVGRRLSEAHHPHGITDIDFGTDSPDLA